MLHQLLLVVAVVWSASRGNAVNAQTLSQDCAIANSIWQKMGQITSIPSSCCSLSAYGIECSSTRITSIDWASRSLRNSIPTEIGKLTGLQKLYLFNNQLSGSIPSSLGSLTGLQKLHLSGNQLSGSIPFSLGSLTSLQSLQLSINQLSGSIPFSLGSLTGLQILWLESNQLSGSIPSSLGNLKELRLLYLYRNQLSGPIPSSLGSLTSLEILGLSNNQLSGSIPSSLGSLTSLEMLGLSNNQLSGSIPSSLGSLTSLQYLWLAGNQLSGSIPSFLDSLTSLQSLHLSSNQLSGSIPSSLGNLKELRWLYLDRNQLFGSIPSSLGSLTSLQYLWLYGNQLSGSIPSSLGSLTSLQSLWLYNNQLTKCPPEIVSMPGDKKIFPNPIKKAPQVIVVPASIGTLSNLTLDIIMKTKSPIQRKRQILNPNAAPATTEELLNMCPLNNVQGADVAAGCIAGIYKSYCTNSSDTQLLNQCHDAYNRAFAASFFKSIGDVCPAWKQGPRSAPCALAITQFSYNYFIGKDPSTGRDVFLKLNSTHATQLVGSIFASKTYAPCVAPACKWP